MPMFILYTNISSAKQPENFLTETSKFMAKAIDKPESYVAIRAHFDVAMIHAGSNEPCGTVELKSIGKLGVEENKVLSNTIAEYLEKTLGIKPNRCFIHFIDLDGSDVGYNKTTF